MKVPPVRDGIVSVHATDLSPIIPRTHAQDRSLPAVTPFSIRFVIASRQLTKLVERIMNRGKQNIKDQANRVAVIASSTLAALVLQIVVGTTFAQGNLDPPGSPAPTMKTLQQVEPRIEINAANTPGDADSVFKITSPGSYYLTTNIIGVVAKHGIEIAAHDVTLDLNGFALIGVPGSLDGVTEVAQFLNTTIRNGSLRGWGGDGVRLFDSINCRLLDLSAASNGGSGLYADGKGAVVSRCVSAGNNVGGIRGGIASLITGCAVYSNVGTGIVTGAASTVTDCSVSSNGGSGIVAGDQNTVSRCTSRLNGGDGVSAIDGSTVSGCTASSNSGNGISAGIGSTVSYCTVNSNTGDGIATSASTTVIGCTSQSNSKIGINTGPGCTVISCVAQSNGISGIDTSGGSTVSRSTARFNLGDGIATERGNTINNCTAQLNTGNGIRITDSCLVQDNTCELNGTALGDGAGIHVTGSDNRIDGNNVISNDRGIDVDASGNLIIRNSASGNSTNYSIVVNNKVGEIMTAPNSTVINGSTGGAGVGTTNPWANFSY